MGPIGHNAYPRGDVRYAWPLADWIDVFDQMVFDYADRLRFLNAFVWDYTIKGADPKMVEAFKAELLKSPPRQGGVQVHNDQITIAAATPDLKGADMSEAARGFIAQVFALVSKSPGDTAR